MAISFVKEFSGASGSSPASTTTTTVTVPAGGVAVGHGLVVSMACLHDTTGVSSVSGSDPRGNTYTHLETEGIVTNPNNTVTVLYTTVTTTLQAGDVISFTPNIPTSRCAINIYELDKALTYDVHAYGDNGGSFTTNLVAGTTPTTTVANELVIGSFMLVNAGRTFTPGTGYSGGTKVLSTGGSGERAIATEYKLVSSTGTQSATATLNSSGQYIGITSTFSEYVPTVRTGKPKVWNGSAWVAHDAKVWNGIAWVAHKAKGYDGGNWVDSK